MARNKKKILISSLKVAIKKSHKKSDYTQTTPSWEDFLFAKNVWPINDLSG